MLRRLSLLAFVSACGLFPDVGSLSGDAGGSDATNDVTTTSDATPDVTTDAPTDAGLDVKKSPCAQQHTFCDDFDDGSLGATWDKPNSSGGTLSQTTNAISPPYAFQAQVSGSGHPYALLEKYLPASQHVHYECDMIILGAQSSGMEVDYFDFGFAPAGYTYGNFNMERLDDAGDIEQISKANGADAEAYHDDSIGEAFTSWKHLVIDIDFAKDTFTASVDGATIDAMTMTPPFTAASSTLSVGITYTGGITTQWTVIIDNVVVDLQ